eukprot:scaffold3068_cov401-Prasinococcus_capsulatus_cf.AAC.51
MDALSSPPATSEDVLVFNFGVHYNPPRDVERYRQDVAELGAALARLRTERGATLLGVPRMVFVETSVQHFASTDDGRYAAPPKGKAPGGGPCRRFEASRQRSQNWRNEMIGPTLSTHGVVRLRVFDLFQPLWDAHVPERTPAWGAGMQLTWRTLCSALLCSAACHHHDDGAALHAVQGLGKKKDCTHWCPGADTPSYWVVAMLQALLPQMMAGASNSSDGGGRRHVPHHGAPGVSSAIGSLLRSRMGAL